MNFIDKKYQVIWNIAQGIMKGECIEYGYPCNECYLNLFCYNEESKKEIIFNAEYFLGYEDFLLRKQNEAKRIIFNLMVKDL